MLLIKIRAGVGRIRHVTICCSGPGHVICPESGPGNTYALRDNEIDGDISRDATMIRGGAHMSHIRLTLT